MNASRLLCLFLLLGFLLPPAQSVQASGHSRFTLSDLGEEDIVVRRLFGQKSVSFRIAAGQEVQRAVLYLHMAHSKKLLSEFSDLTIGVNEEPVFSMALTAETVRVKEMEIELPGSAFRTGSNELVFRFKLRTRDKGCEDLADDALWARVYADSALEIESVDRAPTVDLSAFPAPLDTVDLVEGAPRVIILLPEAPLTEELTAAVRLAATLGRETGWEKPPLVAMTASQADPAQLAADHLVAIGIAGRNPLLKDAPNGASLQVSPYSGGRVLLGISGKDGAELLAASDLLATRSLHSTLRGAAMVAAAPVTAQAIVEHPEQASFAELGFETRRVRGIGAHDLYYAIDVPYNWKVTSEAAIDIGFTHSKSLNVDGSLMTAFFNGFQVAEVPLTASNAGDGRLVVKISPRQIHPGRNWLHLAYDLGIKRADCNFRYLEEAWAEVDAARSLVSLGHVKGSPPLELRYLPAPLVVPEDLSATVLVVAPRASQAELTSMVRLAAKLGTYASADGIRLSALSADQVDVGRLANAAVVAIGTPQTNSLLAAYDDDLPQPLQRINGLVQASSGRELFPEEAEGKAGYLELIEAPWSSQAVLITVSAFGDEQLLKTVDAFPVLGKRFKSQGNVAVVVGNKVKGITAGSLAGVTLSSQARITLAVVFAILLVLGGTGIILRQKKSARIHKQE